ncbi:phenylalanyl-tRNA synthetase beta chain [Parabacteroides sp. PF5-5]|uniref:phenylalanine--tRNA ligase subunit beta n=1 Tax=unclassified Parabacteroides TaxID=2649774 RepID=UPI002476C149|nr:MULTISPECIES: phenylalanine--tRNA ligase subunit beta [unclassified Parabacteroides]MDH6304329.1 phenylalanyl-tRNA synthetase beta chain [Parabacteroides sp. PH5-39]MDH6315518.1 phenylalanyl-tRNA synthetase beta chain [Parabacteroides sp. PF5-13]MDH6318988.1 phenylalanyl-tRNA synthetase beta chain [Parabacteroides sp. PH5-13]MDH6322717.1 phenylalanyl-tRNA synthetase beta chain [Parabacteroides sp. PH5-8]MDH6326711.1 phenylalanyl-tRNA synthetase beta chain [Parabacteroides sp. PH5-41]
MNISYNWLKNYLDFDLQPEEVSAALTSIGLETGGVEEVQTIKGGLEGLVIGEVLTCVEHPNSDHLHITTVNVGGEEPLQIVCGAPNVAAGQKVVVAVNGTKLYSGDESFTIKRSKIRGVESNGMICAEDEIGIGKSHDGIIVLPADAVVGTLAKDYYNIKSDYVLEVDITPNRVDATSHFGVARDLAAYLKQNGKPSELKRPSVDAFKIDDPAPAITVSVENTEACPRYSGVTIKGVTVKESPEWLQNILKIIGLRPINNVVDITNYVLHELGQPLHAFDADKIKGRKVVVKTLPAGTKFVTLDEVERTLTDKDLMICNAEEGMCIGGVFGGLDSGVTEGTTNVFLESANFNASWVRKTARRFGLNTDSSFRFERGLDPNNTMYVLKRAALMIKEIAGGTICGELQDVYPVQAVPYTVDITYKKINTLIGKEIPKDTIKSILSSLEIEIVSETAEGMTLHVPLYRIDVQRDVDVIEDILRIYGYNNIEIGEDVKSNLSYQTPTDRSYKLQNLISEQLCGAGFSEIMNNSQTRSAYYTELSTYPEARCVMLENPISSDLNVMRQTLLFGGLESIEHNEKRKNGNIRFYEFGNCYDYDVDKKSDENVLASYKEDYRLALWVCGKRVENSWAHPDELSSIYELKAYVENILARLGISKNTVILGQLSNDIYDAGLSITTKAGRQLGTMGIVSKKICKALDIDEEVYYAELSWELLMKEIRKSKVSFSEISKFPAVKRDLALLLDKNIRFEEIEKIANESERKLLKDVTLFDVYEGKNLPAGKKSYAVSFYLQDEDKTLNDKQIEAIMKKLQTNLEQKLGAQLR